MRLTVVGCSGSVPGPGSAASCYLVEATTRNAGGQERTWRVLLDLGSGALGPLQQYLDVGGVDAVLLSHLHPDHCLDLCSLYVALKYGTDRSRAHPVAVHGPAGTAQRIARAYDAETTSNDGATGDAETTSTDGADGDGMHPELSFTTWQAGVPVQIGPLTVTPHPVRHPVEAYGLRIESRGAVLAYTGDTAGCRQLLPLARDADLLLAEAAFLPAEAERTPGVHLTGAEAGRLAADAGARRLVVTHVPPWHDPHQAAARAREVYRGPVEAAVPGAVWDVGPA